jgi:CubicO group peptidase (beta-lactamase class C family)
MTSSAPAFPRTEPEAVGLSSQRLRRIGEALRREVAEARIPGAVVGIMRAGKLAHFEAVGHRDPAGKEPLGTDAIFSIASMTKPMTSTAIMMLVEEGRVLLADPVSKYLPPLAALKVAQDGGRAESRAPKSLPTIQDLLRHSSGLTYTERGNTPAHKAYPGSSIVTAERMSKDDTIAALAKSPLLFDSGSDWEYGFSTDVLGFVVEAVTGQPLGAFLAQRLWGPLGMSDTSFALPAAKRPRYALALAKDPLTGNANPAIHHATDKTQMWDSGGGGTVSTAADYLRFTEMLRSGGRLGAADILGRGTVKFMTSDHLPATLGGRIADTMDPAATGYGFGLGFAVRRQDGIAAMAGSAGDYYWSGVYGTYFWIDPREELSVVFFAAAPGLIRLRYRQMLRNLVYQALI